MHPSKRPIAASGIRYPKSIQIVVVFCLIKTDVYINNNTFIYRRPMFTPNIHVCMLWIVSPFICHTDLKIKNNSEQVFFVSLALFSLTKTHGHLLHRLLFDQIQFVCILNLSCFIHTGIWIVGRNADNKHKSNLNI